MVTKKLQTPEERIKEKISAQDPDSFISFYKTDYCLNDLLNNNSFISLYPDVLDLLFYEPEIQTVLDQFGTSHGFVANIKSVKEVAMDSFLTNAMGKKIKGVVKAVKKKEEMDETEQLVQFLTTYVEAQVFNSLLRTVNEGLPDTRDAEKVHRIDPQEYFDEVASAVAEAVSHNIKPENVKPQLFNSPIEYTIYPLSESVARTDMLDHLSILVTFTGNIGVEKVAGGLFKKGKLNVLIDVSIKTIVFNGYMYSKRGLNIILNGIRERRHTARTSLLDEDEGRLQNSVTSQATHERGSKVGGSLMGDIGNKVVSNKLNATTSKMGSDMDKELNKIELQFDKMSK